jgi:spore photoproduct lyase
VHVNRESLWTELDGFLASRKGKITRIGTGELGDSLVLDHITGSSKDLISYFRGKPDVFFELKTKTANIRSLLEIDPAENIVVSWSLNAEGIARREEVGAPRVKERIDAARLVSRRGFPVAFHFDPIIYHPGWREAYAKVINDMLKAVPSSRIAWISLGCLRFTPSLKRAIRAAFPRSRILGGEFIPAKDGKWRYFRPLRTELYEGILEALESQGGGGIPVYLCMESHTLWKALEKIKKRGRKACSSSFPLRVVYRDQKCLWL